MKVLNSCINESPAGQAPGMEWNRIIRVPGSYCLSNLLSSVLASSKAGCLYAVQILCKKIVTKGILFHVQQG